MARGGLKRSETHKVLFNRTFANHKPKSMALKQPPKFLKYPKSINLRKKLIKYNARFDNLNKARLKTSSEKVLMKKPRPNIIKWKDYIKMVKQKQVK